MAAIMPVYGNTGGNTGASVGQAPQGLNPNPTRTPEWELKQAEAQVNKVKTQIAAQEAAKKRIKKPSSKDKKALAAYNAQISKINAKIGAMKDSLGKLKEGVVTAQNKVYESKGEYEKLLRGADRDAYLAVKALFKNYGLESLSDNIYNYVKDGFSADTISLLLQDTSEYKERFAGNEARKKAGLPVLSPAEYLSVEASYRQIMASAGLPVGFYDQNSDFATWIGKNTSPSEIQSRVDLATQATILAAPGYKQALNQMGISDSDLTAYFLNPTKALPYLQKSAATAAVGAEALNQGLTFDKAYAEQLALMGIGQEEARQGYSQVATELETFQALGQIYGEDWGQRQSEEAIFEGDADALKTKGRLLSRERGAFSGATGTGRAGLGGSQVTQ